MDAVLIKDTRRNFDNPQPVEQAPVEAPPTEALAPAEAPVTPKVPDTPQVQFEPLYDRVLVYPLDRGEVNVNGIYIPQTAQEVMKEGVIVAVGEGYVSDRGEVRALRTKPGDIVLFGLYAGAPIELDNKEFLVMREAEVFGKVKKQ